MKATTVQQVKVRVHFKGIDEQPHRHDRYDVNDQKANDPWPWQFFGRVGRCGHDGSACNRATGVRQTLGVETAVLAGGKLPKLLVLLPTSGR